MPHYPAFRDGSIEKGTIKSEYMTGVKDLRASSLINSARCALILDNALLLLIVVL